MQRSEERGVERRDSRAGTGHEKNTHTNKAHAYGETREVHTARSVNIGTHARTRNVSRSAVPRSVAAGVTDTSTHDSIDCRTDEGRSQDTEIDC
jgi:hypothetical protein